MCATSATNVAQNLAQNVAQLFFATMQTDGTLAAARLAPVDEHH